MAKERKHKKRPRSTCSQCTPSGMSNSIGSTYFKHKVTPANLLACLPSCFIFLSLSPCFFFAFSSLPKQTCSGEPIPPDEIVKRDRDKREKKLRKQLERQSRRLQQSRLKPGINTATLTEAIHQTLCEIRTLNRLKDARELIGSDLYALLVNTLDIDVTLIMSKVDHTKAHPHLTSGTSSARRSSSFSIENLLNGCQPASKQDAGRPAPFIQSSSYSGSEYQDSDSSDCDVDDASHSDLMSSRASSPELEVTDDTTI